MGIKKNIVIMDPVSFMLIPCVADFNETSLKIQGPDFNR